MKCLKFILLVFVMVLPSVQAHKVEALFSEFSVDEDSWSLKVTLDATLAVPELRDDPDIPQPKREWILKQSEESYQQMREEAERYLGKALRFTYSESASSEDLPYTVSFPGFEKAPYNFPNLATGGAYFIVMLSGDLDSAASGAFRLHLAKGKFPTLLVNHSSEAGGGNSEIHTLRSNNSLTLFGELGDNADGQGVHESSGSGIISLIHFGFIHVIPEGLDHILFILALFLLQRNWSSLLKQSIVFTVAHSIALGLSISGMLDGINVYIGSWIEPLIALSIFYLAVENIMPQKVSSDGKPANKRMSLRLSVVFVFGLVHGLGFGSTLGDVLRQAENWVKPLIMANIGIELAQVVVLAVAWLVTAFFAKSKGYSLFAKVVSGAIACIALWMFITRVIG